MEGSNNDEIIEKYFDEIWVYGDPNVYDCRAEYGFSTSIRERMCFTGYLDQSSRLWPTSVANMPQQPLALCVVGGGQDGIKLASTFVEAGVPYGWRGVVITGPFMPAADKQNLLQQAATRRSQGSGPIDIIDQLVEADRVL